MRQVQFTDRLSLVLNFLHIGLNLHLMNQIIAYLGKIQVLLQYINTFIEKNTYTKLESQMKNWIPFQNSILWI